MVSRNTHYNQVFILPNKDTESQKVKGFVQTVKKFICPKYRTSINYIPHILYIHVYPYTVKNKNYNQYYPSKGLSSDGQLPEPEFSGLLKDNGSSI